MRHVHNENVVFHLGIEERPMHRDLTCVGCPVLGQTWPIARQCWHELLLTIGWVIGPLKHPLVDVSMSTTRIFIIGMSVIQVVHVDSTGQTTTKYCCLCMKDPLAGPLWVTNHTSHSSPIALRSNTTLIPWLQIIWTDPSTSTCCTARARPYNTTTRHHTNDIPRLEARTPVAQALGEKTYCIINPLPSSTQVIYNWYIYIYLTSFLHGQDLFGVEWPPSIQFCPNPPAAHLARKLGGKE